MATPTIHITEAARGAILETASDAEGAPLRIAISSRFDYSLSFGARETGDIIVEAGGITIALDPESATRGHGMTIDFVAGPEGAGFTIDNPNQPARIRQLTAPQLKAMIDEGFAFELVDVRTESECEIARIEGARRLDQACHDQLIGLDKDTAIVFQCHHGMRSQAAAEYWLQQGFRNLYNLEGGIDAWSRLVDPSIARY